MGNFKKILGIDPGYGRMGWAVISKVDGREKVDDSGCIETSAGTAHERRLLEIGKKISKVISRHRPDIMAIEKLFFTTNQKTALQVSEARGVAIYAASAKGLSIKELTPLEVKTAVCGYGRADKKQVESMIKSLLKIDKLPKYDDTTDAIAIALTAFAYNGRGDYL